MVVSGGSLESLRVAAAAGARGCPVVLELGGKDAFLVFADADLDMAIPIIRRAILQNAGQTCSAGSRVLVERSTVGEVTERLKAAFRAARADGRPTKVVI